MPPAYCTSLRLQENLLLPLAKCLREVSHLKSVQIPQVYGHTNNNQTQSIESERLSSLCEHALSG